MANWNWKAVRWFIEARCGIRLCRSACTRYLHRLGFVYKRPKKRLLRADEAKRAAFVEEYAALLAEARVSAATIFFADEAHFRADGDLHGKWVLKGRPALVDSTCPRWGEKASYYSAVCLETGETEYMELSGTSSSATSVAFLTQLRANHAGPLVVIWDNGPAHGGEAVRDYLATPNLACEWSACRPTAPTSTPTRRSGPGRARRSPPTPAWAPKRRYRRRWLSSSPGCRATPPRCSPAAAANCKPWPKRCPRQRPSRLTRCPM